MQAHHGPARWHDLGERHRPSFHVPPVRQHLRSHLVLVWALRLFLEPVSRQSRDSRDASGRHRPGRRGRRRSHPRGWVSILPVPLPVEWPPPRGRGTETAPTTKKLSRQNHHWPRRVSLSSLRRQPRRGRHDPRDERREVGASSDDHPGSPIPVLGADRARRAHGVERLPAELRVVIVVRIDARRVDARGVVR